MQNTDRTDFNRDYMEWLEKFTRINKSFMDEDWKYEFHKIDSQDKEYAESLRKLYLSIEDYAIEKQIMPLYNSYQCSYFIEYHGTGYEIGFFVKNDQNQVSFYCNRLDEKQDVVSFIDRKDKITYIDMEELINKPNSKTLMPKK